MDYIRDYRLKGIPFHLSLPPPDSAGTPLPATLSLLATHPLSPSPFQTHFFILHKHYGVFSSPPLSNLLLSSHWSPPMSRPDSLLLSSCLLFCLRLFWLSQLLLLTAPPSLGPHSLPPASLSFASSSDILPARCRPFLFAFSQNAYH